MAGSYTPTITTFTTPFLDVVSISSTSYEEIQESLGSDIYLAKNLLVEASSIIQLNEPISILTYDVDGNIFQDNVYNLADPFQYQTSYLQEFKNKGLILDGKSRIELILRPFSDMRLVFTAEEIVPDASDALDKINRIGRASSRSRSGLDILDGTFADDDIAKEPIFDNDFLNRTGLFNNVSTSIPYGQEIELEDLFGDYSEKLN
jgi:hypothetical protein